MLMCDRNQHSIVKHLSSIKNKNARKNTHTHTHVIKTKRGDGALSVLILKKQM